MKAILKGLVLTAMILLIVGLFLPSQVRVERSVVIDAPVDSVFETVNGFARFNEWSPWHAMDPYADFQLQGPASGIGATLIWRSEVTGSGRQTVVNMEANRVVEIALLFDGQDPATATYVLAPKGSKTQLSWIFEASFGFDLPARYFGLLFDHLIGSDYERGLRNLKALLESETAGQQPTVSLDDSTDDSSREVPSAVDPAPSVPEHQQIDTRPSVSMQVVDIEPVSIAVASGIATVDSEDVATELSRAYQKIATHLFSQGLKMGTPPVSITRGWIRSGEYAFDAGVPVNPDRLKPSAEVRLGHTPGGRVLKAIHVGSYDSLSDTYQAMVNYMSEQGLNPGEYAWEAYVDDPAHTPEDQLQTIIYYQLASGVAAP